MTDRDRYDDITPISVESPYQRPSDRPSWELAAEHHVKLMLPAIEDAVARRTEPLAKSIRTLADAFNEHTTDEQKRSAAMLKAIAAMGAVKLTFPVVALIVSLLSLWIVTSLAQDAHARPPACLASGGSGQ